MSIKTLNLDVIARRGHAGKVSAAIATWAAAEQRELEERGASFSSSDSFRVRRLLEIASEVDHLAAAPTTGEEAVAQTRFRLAPEG